jgi:hypothetical protein
VIANSASWEGSNSLNRRRYHEMKGLVGIGLLAGLLLNWCIFATGDNLCNISMQRPSLGH